MEAMMNVLAAGKGTALELAKARGVKPDEAIKLLQQLERKGRAWQLNGLWRAGAIPESYKPREAEPKLTTTDELINLVIKHAPVTSAELAAIEGLNHKSVASTLSILFANGRIGRTGSKTYTYTSPAVGVEAFLKTIPQMGEHAS